MPRFFCSFPAEILHHKACEGEAEDGGRVGYGSVDVHFLFVPVGGGCMALMACRFRAIGLARLFAFALKNGVSICKDLPFIRDESVVFRHLSAFVRQHFGGVDDAELAGREQLGALELLAQGTCQRTTLHVPELVDADLRGVHLQSGTH